MPSAAHVDTGLLLYKVDYRDSDLVLTFFTHKLGKLSALARGARRSRKRFGGVLEPMHTLNLHFDERASSELAVLREASIHTARTRLVTRLGALQAAGRALGWVRHGVPHRAHEPLIFNHLTHLLDRLNQAQTEDQDPLFLAEFGLLFLGALGFGLDLQNCVRCNRACQPGRAAFVDAKRGGLICRACGGATQRLDGARRERLAQASDGATNVLSTADVDDAISLIEQVLRAHMGYEGG